MKKVPGGKHFFDAEGVKRAVAQAIVKPLEACAILLRDEAQRLVSIAGGGEPSAPGQPPHLQTGRGRRYIFHAEDTQATTPTYVIGPTPPGWYMGWIHERGGYFPWRVREFGGRYFPPRPFLRPARDAVAPSFPQFFISLPIASTPAGRELNSRRGGET